MHELAMIDGTAMKSKRIIIPSSLQRIILEQLYSNHVGIDKMGCLASESMYWVNMNACIKKS